MDLSIVTLLPSSGQHADIVCDLSQVSVIGDNCVATRKGIKNMGNTCFIASSMQVFFLSHQKAYWVCLLSIFSFVLILQCGLYCVSLQLLLSIPLLRQKLKYLQEHGGACESGCANCTVARFCDLYWEEKEESDAVDPSALILELKCKAWGHALQASKQWCYSILIANTSVKLIKTSFIFSSFQPQPLAEF